MKTINKEDVLLESSDTDINTVKKVCLELGITQKELAEKFGISTSAISQ